MTISYITTKAASIYVLSTDAADCFYVQISISNQYGSSMQCVRKDILACLINQRKLFSVINSILQSFATIDVQIEPDYHDNCAKLNLSSEQDFGAFFFQICMAAFWSHLTHFHFFSNECTTKANIKFSLTFLRISSQFLFSAIPKISGVAVIATPNSTGKSHTFSCSKFPSYGRFLMGFELHI